MSTWPDLVTAALLGSQHAAAPALPAELAEAVKADSASLLAQAGALDLWRQAGRLVGSAPAAPALAPVESRPLLPARARAHWPILQRGEFPHLLLEWLQTLPQAGWRLPAATLPELLSWAGARAARREAVLAAGGQRAHWLAAQHPDWSRGAAPTPLLEPAVDPWETGSLPERVAHLTARRRTEAAAAREQLTHVWASEPAAARTALLEALATGLGAEDEPFLESVLADRSKEARRGAVDLLARLPGSDFVARQTARAEAALSWRAGKIELALPAAPDAAGQRDGLDLKLPGLPAKLGERAVQLVLVLSAVPPAHWSQRFGARPADLVAAAKAHEFSIALLTGLAWATVRHRAADWAEALLEARVTPSLPEAAALPSVLEDTALERWLLRQLTGQFDWNLREPLLALPRPWSRELVVAVVRGLAASTGAAYRIPRTTFAEFEALLVRIPVPHVREACGTLDSSVPAAAQLQEYLTFRLEVLGALQPDSPP